MSRQPLSREDTAILVPALNESLRIREVVNDALTYCSNVIVIDDGSDDG
ncbi:glycosyltransferase family 2 protein, partial [Xanthomonas hortorum pv. pelargonii]|nr:glycosyltransferase family 2 protein [Xanthomonas hortorum pv. pelargonii]